MTDNPLAHLLADIAQWRDRPGPSGIPSVCSAHSTVIEAAMRATLPTDLPLLIEATCNQVNQEGGYTGMRPADFRAMVERIGDAAGFPRERIVLGGDHLGPNPWRTLPPDEAMDRAEAMIRAYAAAGFGKLHLDCSMGCAGEPAALGDAETALRAARLVAAAEDAWPRDAPRPVYVVGTEVPPPGGATHAIDALEPTDPDAARETVAVHGKAFETAGLSDAFSRVVALVVQPGVEFGNRNVVDYDRDAARALADTLSELPGMVFEAHSTDYQAPAALAALVEDGFAILKVGPGLTFALREALYGLDAIAGEIAPGRSLTLREAMEAVMLADPTHWRGHYEGDDAALMRHFSFSDRIRYYWPVPEAAAAADALMDALGEGDLPEPLIGQHLGRLAAPVREGRVEPRARALVLAAVETVMTDYLAACLKPPSSRHPPAVPRR